MHRNVFITGGTGYLGPRLIRVLQQRGHRITAVARKGSERRLPAGCEIVQANVLEGSSWEQYVRASQTLVHLVGVPHPSPSKAQQFIDIDLRSIREAAAIARKAGVEHFIYVSVAQPAPAMKAYLGVRAQGEATLRDAGINTTVLRPWYVLGPGHRWPLLLVPFYRLAEWFPATSEGAKRLGLLRLDEMIAALAWTVENPAAGMKILAVPEIRAIARTLI